MMQAVNWRGTVNARRQSATCCPSDHGRPIRAGVRTTMNVAAARPKNPIANGLATGRSTMRVRPSELLDRGSPQACCSSDYERLGRASLDAGQEPVGLRFRVGVTVVATSFRSLSLTALPAWSAIVQVIATPWAHQVERTKIFEQRAAAAR